jgi:phosphoribosylaminoimidazole-succinocarboxamide synthase
MDNGFQGKAGQQVPEMTPQIVQSITDRYVELFEGITGDTFVREEAEDLHERIRQNIVAYLQNNQ